MVVSVVQGTVARQRASRLLDSMDGFRVLTSVATDVMGKEGVPLEAIVRRLEVDEGFRREFGRLVKERLGIKGVADEVVGKISAKHLRRVANTSRLFGLGGSQLVETIALKHMSKLGALFDEVANKFGMDAVRLANKYVNDEGFRTLVNNYVKRRLAVLAKQEGGIFRLLAKEGPELAFGVAALGSRLAFAKKRDIAKYFLAETAKKSPKTVGKALAGFSAVSLYGLFYVTMTGALAQLPGVNQMVYIYAYTMQGLGHGLVRLVAGMNRTAGATPDANIHKILVHQAAQAAQNQAQQKPQ